MGTLRTRLNEPIDGLALVGFRIVFGALMLFEALHVFLPWTDEILSPKRFHLNYPVFAFVSPLPSPWHTLEPVVLALLAAGVLAGYRFRLCAVLFTLVYAHIFFIDQLVFNNHLYLYMLMAGLLAATPAAKFWSVDSRREPPAGGAATASRYLVPKWSIYLLRFQLIVVYFYGGVAKLNADWLQGEPVRHWMHLLSERLWLGEVLNQEWCVMGVCYGGILFDLGIGFLLVRRRTFLPAACAAIGFHAINSQLFLIGSFPVFGILSLILFLPPEDGRKWFNKGKEWLVKKREPAVDAAMGAANSAHCGGQINRTGLAFAAVYVLIQVVLPLRPWFQSGNPSWTDGSNTFAWRMMLREKDSEAQFMVSPEARALLAQYPQLLLTQDQSEIVTEDPDLLYQYATWLSGVFTAMGIQDTSVRIHSICSLNGRPFQQMIDPTVDLSRADNPLLGTASWIVPLDESLPIGRYPTSNAHRNQLVQLAMQAGAIAPASGGNGGLSASPEAVHSGKMPARDVAGK